MEKQELKANNLNKNMETVGVNPNTPGEEVALTVEEEKYLPNAADVQAAMEQDRPRDLEIEQQENKVVNKAAANNKPRPLDPKFVSNIDKKFDINLFILENGDMFTGAGVDTEDFTVQKFKMLINNDLFPGITEVEIKLHRKAFTKGEYDYITCQELELITENKMGKTRPQILARELLQIIYNGDKEKATNIATNLINSNYKSIEVNAAAEQQLLDEKIMDMLEFNGDTDRIAYLLPKLNDLHFYNLNMKDYMYYNGVKWERDKDNFKLQNKIEQVTMELKTLAKIDELHKKGLTRQYQIFNNNSSRASIINHLKPKVLIKEEDLDLNNNLLNFTNCTLDLESMSVLEHSPYHLITNVVNCAYDPNADCPMFKEFIKEIMCNDQEEILALECLLGYLLSDKNEQKFPILWGRGANGKSVLVEVLQNLFKDYATEVDVDLFLDHGRIEDPERPSPQKLQIKGKKLICIGENKENVKFNTGLIKKVTGHDAITSRYLQSNDMITFRVEGKTIQYTNFLPYFSGNDSAMVRRILVYPFYRIFKENEKDLEKAKHLLSESNGIFNYLLECLQKYNKYGLYKSPKVEYETKTYKEKCDKTELFVDEVCIVGDDKLHVKQNELYRIYKEWCTDYMEVKPLSKMRFYEEVKSKGYVEGRIDGYKTFKGIAPNYDKASGELQYKLD